MCEHNNLEAMKFEAKQQEASKGIVLTVEESNPWAFVVSDTAGKYSYLMGRIYKCKDCGEKFVIQNMFALQDGEKK